jgi:hypothetical protein
MPLMDSSSDVPIMEPWFLQEHRVMHGHCAAPPQSSGASQGIREPCLGYGSGAVQGAKVVAMYEHAAEGTFNACLNSFITRSRYRYSEQSASGKPLFI